MGTMETARVARGAPVRARASTSRETRERFARDRVRSVHPPRATSRATTSGGGRGRARATVETPTTSAMRRWRRRAGAGGTAIEGEDARARCDDDDEATDRDRATGRAKRRQRARDAVDDEDEAAMREAFLDGAELFALGTAVAVKARAAHVERRTAVARARPGTRSTSRRER